MINKVTLIGHLGGNPDVRRLESGVAVAKFSVATNESYKDNMGNWQDRTEWHSVVAWRRMAEIAESGLKKGSLVYVDGKLTTRKWQDQNGNDRYTTEVVVNYLRNLSGKGDSGSFPSAQDDPMTMTTNTTATTNSDAPSSDSGNSTTEAAENAASTPDSADDDLPF